MGHKTLSVENLAENNRRSGCVGSDCATERNAATAGGVYPFLLFEDGDFDIPSVYMKDSEGEKLLPVQGKQLNWYPGQSVFQKQPLM